MASLFSFQGTIGRGEFLLKFIPSVAVIGVIGGETDPPTGAGLIAYLAALVIASAALARRSRDRGHSGWWALWVFVPLMNFVVFFQCCFLPSAGPIEANGTRYAPFFIALFQMLGKFAKADGHVTQSEIDLVQRFMNDTGLPAEDQVFAKKYFNQGKDDSRDIRAIAQSFRAGQSDEEMRLIAYIILVDVAQADGEIDDAEREILKDLPSCLGIDEACYARYAEGSAGQAGGSEPSIDDHYATLGCSPDATDAELKRAYREAARKFHPDTLAAKGLPEEFTAFAVKQSQELNNAYEAIKRARGL